VADAFRYLHAHQPEALLVNDSTRVVQIPRDVTHITMKDGSVLKLSSWTHFLEPVAFHKPSNTLYVAELP